MHTQTPVCATASKWRSEDNLVETVLSFHIMWVLVLKFWSPGLCDICLYPPEPSHQPRVLTSTSQVVTNLSYHPILLNKCRILFDSFLTE